MQEDKGNDSDCSFHSIIDVSPIKITKQAQAPR